MSQAKPLISVLMPVCNSEKYISKAIDSILNQTYENFELLIADSSQDNTSEMIKLFRDSRIIYYNVKNYSIPQALNFLLEKSKGEFIARMDADDICDVKRLQTQLDILIDYNEIVILGTNFYYISESGKILFEKKMPERHEDIEFVMPIYSSVLHPTIMCKKSVFNKVGNFNPKYLIEDVEFFLRCMEKGIRFVNIQIPLYYYRVREKNKIVLLTQKKEQYKLGYEYITKHKNENFYLRLALLEYYNGEMRNARKYFFNFFKLNSKKSFFILRYLPLTFLGSKITNFLRDNLLLLKINFFLNRFFKVDIRNIYYKH